jgi:hypothetical protein
MLENLSVFAVIGVDCHGAVGTLYRVAFICVLWRVANILTVFLHVPITYSGLFQAVHILNVTLDWIANAALSTFQTAIARMDHGSDSYL